MGLSQYPAADVAYRVTDVSLGDEDDVSCAFVAISRPLIEGRIDEPRGELGDLSVRVASRYSHNYLENGLCEPFRAAVSHSECTG